MPHPRRGPMSSRLRIGAASATAVLTILATACRTTGSPTVQSPELPSEKGSRPRTTPGGGEQQAIVAAYNQFWSIASTVDSLPPDRRRDELATVAADPLLTRVLDGITAQLAAGQRQFGTVRTRPQLVDETSGQASIVDCQDASHSGTVDTTTGLPDMVGSARTPVAATLTYGADHRWRVSQARYLDGSC
jgi:hypothetical protein